MITNKYTNNVRKTTTVSLNNYNGSNSDGFNSDTTSYELLCNGRRTVHSTRQASRRVTSPKTKIQASPTNNTLFSSPTNPNIYTRNVSHFVTPMNPSRSGRQHTPETKQQMISSRQSRAHLKNVKVLQRTAILVSGLPKKEFQSAKSIESEFRKYGVITNCLSNPKGITSEEEPEHQKNKMRSTSRDFQSIPTCTVYIRFLNEKSATSAIIATNGQNWGNNPKFRLQSCFVNNRYCEEFLNGRFCQDLNCILLHELVKDEKRKNGTSGSTSELRRSSSSSNQQQNCWRSPRRDKAINSSPKQGSLLFLEGKRYQHTKKAFVDAVVHGKNQSNQQCGERGDEDRETPKLQLLQRKRNDVPTTTRIVTPLTRREFNQEGAIATTTKIQTTNHNQPPPFKSDCKGVDILSATHCSNIQILHRRERSPIDLPPARQLFKNTTAMNNVIGPPVTKNNEQSNVVGGIDNPWAIHSPIMIESDNFDTIMTCSDTHCRSYFESAKY